MLSGLTRSRSYQAALVRRVATLVATRGSPRARFTHELYGFRTSLTVRHRDIVDGKPMP